MNADTRFSSSELFQFIDFVGKKGIIKDSKAKNWRGAAQQFLSILDEDEKNDLRSLDIEALSTRYVNLKRSSMTSGSFKIYKSRFKGALTDFISWAEDPVNYSHTGTRATKKTNSKSRITAKKSNSIIKTIPAATSNHTEIHQPHLTQATVDTKTVVFPIPISGGRIVTINNLPYELGKEDADKISAVIKALAMPEP